MLPLIQTLMCSSCGKPCQETKPITTMGSIITAQPAIVISVEAVQCHKAKPTGAPNRSAIPANRHCRNVKMPMNLSVYCRISSLSWTSSGKFLMCLLLSSSDHVSNYSIASLNDAGKNAHIEQQHDLLGEHLTTVVAEERQCVAENSRTIADQQRV